MRFPGVRFIQVDIDKCNETAKVHKVEKLPTIKVMRGVEEYGTIEGGGGKFIEEFANLWNKHATPAEKQRKDALNFAADPSDRTSPLVQHLSTDSEEVNRLAAYPLKQFESYVDGGTRVDLGLPAVSAALPFDLKAHDAACTSVAVSMLDRLHADVKHYADCENAAKMEMMRHLGQRALTEFFNGSGTEADLRAARDGLDTLLDELQELRDRDSRMVHDTIPLLSKAINWLALDTKGNTPDRVKFALRREADLVSTIWIEFLFGALLSSAGEADLQRLNPFLPTKTVRLVMDIMNSVVLRANRIGHANRYASFASACCLITDVHDS